MLGMCSALHELGHEVDLVYTVRNSQMHADKDKLDRICSTHRAVERNTGLRAALSLLPYQVVSRCQLATLDMAKDYDVVIVSDHCSILLKNPEVRSRYWVLRRQNSESDYAMWMAEGSRNLAIKVFFLLESMRFRLWCRFTDKRADQIWFLSTQERFRYLDKSSKPKRRAQAQLVPAALLNSELYPARLERCSVKRVLYFGSFTISINRKAVDWYLQNVHPKVRAAHPDYELVIAGRTGPGLEDWAVRHARAPGFLFLASPEDAEAVYAPGGLFIDPLAHDAGVKLKILEAVRRGFPVICAPQSLTGSGLENGVHARTGSDAEAFARQVIDLLGDPKAALDMATAAQQKLKEHFDIHRDVSRALQALENGTSGVERP